MTLRNILLALALITFGSLAVVAQSGKQTGPQMIRDVDHPAKQRFTKTVGASGATIDTVPEGKVLVLELLTGRAAYLGSGTGAISLMSLYQGNLDSYHIFAPSYYSENSSTNKTYFTHGMKLYIPAGRTIQLHFEGDVTPSFFIATVAGHYVDAQ